METSYKMQFPQPSEAPFSDLIMNISAQTYIEQNGFNL